MALSPNPVEAFWARRCISDSHRHDEAHSVLWSNGYQHRWALCAAVIAAATQTRPPLAVTAPAVRGAPPHSKYKGRIRRGAAPPVPTEGSVDVVRQHVGWLPHAERERLLRFVRLLSLPVETSWLPLLAFMCLRLRVLQLAHKGWQVLQRRLSTRFVRIGTAEQANAISEKLGVGGHLTKGVRLQGRGQLEKGCQILNSSMLGPTLLMDGFRDQSLNTEYYRSDHSACSKTGVPAFRSHGSEYILRSVGPDPEPKSAEWAIFADGHAAAVDESEQSGAVDVEAALAKSPGRINLWAAPSLGWEESTGEGWVKQSEAGVAVAIPPRTPCRIRYLPPDPPRTVDFKDTYFQVAELPVKVWSCGILGVQIVEFALLRRTSAKKLVGAIVKNMSRIKWAVTVTTLALLVHLMIGRWRERRSRGKAVTSDIMGSQSSQQEAQLSAAAIALQALVWMFWALCVMVIFGINVGSVLLVPSLGALFVGFVGRDIISNVLSGLVIYLTQPFAQGDWVTLESGKDGWVREVGIFYTKVVQWDKRPLYVPNFRLIQMSVQNNSRMTNRRIMFNLKVRLRDIPKVPAIVSDMQEMLDEHSEIDRKQHRLVRWRGVGDYYATIWMSCYTNPTEEGIRLKHFVALEQSMLERSASIVYKHGADFASSIERLLPPDASDSQKSTEKAADFAVNPVEMQEVDEQVLRERERSLQQGRLAVLVKREYILKKKEEEVQSYLEELQEKEQEVKEKEEALDVETQNPQEGEVVASSPMAMASVDAAEPEEDGHTQDQEINSRDWLKETVPEPAANQELAVPTRKELPTPTRQELPAPAPVAEALSEEELQQREAGLRSRERQVDKQWEKARTKQKDLDERTDVVEAASAQEDDAQGAGEGDVKEGDGLPQESVEPDKRLKVKDMGD